MYTMYVFNLDHITNLCMYRQLNFVAIVMKTSIKYAAGIIIVGMGIYSRITIATPQKMEP